MRVNPQSKKKNKRLYYLFLFRFFIKEKKNQPSQDIHFYYDIILCLTT